ncbi:uncharacterized protein LOC126743306 [Anthonomus grandis grandis]|uniref:uncharacterized protein LOC126743306 n=1 Tax=Anthonomus grandis grandis TaxID=2921223 RepID=UPI00216545BA|nr:uncharacterized protein LOC126743306 [Anthonomus grandis grandis]
MSHMTVKKDMNEKGCRTKDSPGKLQKEESRGSTPISPLRMPDLPLPTPPPMANIMMTSRIGYRRILGNRGPEYRSPILGHRSHSMEFGSRSPSFYGNLPNPPILDSMRQDYYASRDSIEAKAKNVEAQVRSQTLDSRRQVFREKRASTVEFASPMMARAYLSEREKLGRDRRLEAVGHQAMLTDQLGLSPLPRHRNFEILNKRLEDFSDYPIYPHLYNIKSPDPKITQEHKSKYLSRDSLLSSELEEVRTLNKELERKYVLDNAEQNISRILGGSNSETSPEYYNVFMNEHYISDIDENEEIKEFACGYKTPPERRLVLLMIFFYFINAIVFLLGIRIKQTAICRKVHQPLASTRINQLRYLRALKSQKSVLKKQIKVLSHQTPVLKVF